MGRADGGILKLRELIAETPEVESDLLALYDFDIREVIAGRIPLYKAEALLNRLPFEPWSMYRANELGGPEHLGWTPDTYKLAEQVDSTNLSVSAIRHMGAKGKMKIPEPTYRPKVKEIEEKIADSTSLADFPIAALIAHMSI